jgi:hypothetical protein
MELRNSLLRARNKYGLFSYSMVEVNKKLVASDAAPYSPIDIHRMWPQRLLEYDSYQDFYAMKMK